jgi:hypothetical protein
MKHVMKLCCTTLLTAFSLFVQAQTEAEMKAWMDYMTPGETHKMIAKSDGEWTADMTMWQAPGAPATKATVACNNKMILGGRYQESKYTGELMGTAFEGISILAYDNAKKNFTSTWIDNMGTGITVMEGAWDNASKSLITKGKRIDPATGKELTIRQVFKLIDDNNQLLEMYTTPAGGKEFKDMEIKLTRKK